MATIEYRRLSGAKAGKGAAKKPTPASKTVRTDDGRLIKMYTLDANSPTFTSELTTVFARNVARARRENKRVLAQGPSGPAED